MACEMMGQPSPGGANSSPACRLHCHAQAAGIPISPLQCGVRNLESKSGRGSAQCEAGALHYSQYVSDAYFKS